MKKFLLLCALATLWAIASLKLQTQVQDPWHPWWMDRKQDLNRALQDFDQELKGKARPKVLGQHLIQMRRAWKQWEVLAAYYFPDWANEINGPPLPKVDVNDLSWQTTLAPQGLQMMEITLGTQQSLDSNQIQALQKLSLGMHWSLRKMDALLPLAPFVKWQILDAVCIELIRVYSLGLSGFDAPSRQGYLKENALALKMSAQIIRQIADQSPEPEKKALLQWSLKLEHGLKDLELAPKDEDFDKIQWIRNTLSPLYGELRKWQSQAEYNALGSRGRAQPSALNPKAQGFFDPQFLNLAAFWRGPMPLDKHAALELGTQLFRSKLLSSDQKLSCASCHNSELGFADGLPKALGKDGHSLQRNSPGLIGAIWQKSFFWDGRAQGLSEQIDHVVFSHGEFNTDYVQIEKRLHNSHWLKLAQRAFGTEIHSLNKSTVNTALAWYMQSLRGGQSQFDLWMRKEQSSMAPAVIRGANLFMGKALCATCHFPPKWGGLLPPLYKDNEFEVIGSTQNADFLHPELDPDLGRGAHFPHPLWKGAFKTPSLSNVSRTAPYMHHGGLATLSEVLEFYQKGGAKGLGLKLDHQTLPFDHLELSLREQKDLLAFLNSLEEPKPRAKP